ncbi:hypothetical protein [Pseudomonas sp. CCC3.1]|uniref:hypothetical protein n=1 Tax=Pseudomonas sp. CCC3.1 TaxID=3048607 RepID=UPI002AC90873|nr:hypothetical protein [Pseudomonas sp. CCC3.1]MEB0207262.1 hypothetical protein [Pseudomonas sp. CCC3.1]WPX34620.1 hypothetical protein RHM56_15025 [Pseudomonas sp. CCC3.1]
MIEANKKITLSGESALKALAELEFILISLHKIGSYYIDKSTDKYQHATTKFIDRKHVTQRLAKVRKILSDSFDPSLGEDDMDDIERHVSQLITWEPPQEAD